MANQIDTDNVIDVRDIIARVEHLEALRVPGPVDLGPDDNATDQDTLFAELAELEEFLADLAGNGGDEQWRGDWYPVTLIRDSYFEEAMDDLLEDIGDIPRNLPSYLQITVDYEALKMDYSITEFRGVTYWYR